MTEKTVVWKGKEVRTIGDLTDAIAALQNREEAQEFIALYRAVSPHAYQNVGYCAGYLDRETAARIWDWCETAHPVFGRRTPTAEEAFEAGRMLGQELRERDK